MELNRKEIMGCCNSIPRAYTRIVHMCQSKPFPLSHSNSLKREREREKEKERKRGMETDKDSKSAHFLEKTKMPINELTSKQRTNSGKVIRTQ